ncbi:hypothetical protein BKA62DRAFT_76036 [Auriculariales sp. MPI-PUGE-AT-0066]|nr:hypothetical protein BKA62DRAFT_76036 [Auriculariales sp. MPI-PUGE-AT-0066]
MRVRTRPRQERTRKRLSTDQERRAFRHRTQSQRVQVRQHANNTSNGNDSGSISPNLALAQKVNANPFDPSTAYAQHQHQSSHSRHPSQSDYAPQQQHPSINSDFTFSAPIAGGFGSASAVGANWQGFDASSMNVDPSAAGGAHPPGSTGPVTFEQGGVFDIWSALYNPVDFLDVQAALNRPPSSADLSPHGPQTQSPPLGTPFSTGLPQTWDASGIPYHQLASAFEHGFAAAGVGHLGGGVGLGELGSDFGGTAAAPRSVDDRFDAGIEWDERSGRPYTSVARRLAAAAAAAE